MKTKMSIPQRIWAYVKGNPIVVMMALVSLIVGCTIKNFFSLNNFNVLMGNTTIRFLIALGVSGCLITKGTDLSAGRQAALAATLTGVMVQRADYASRMFSWMPEMNMWVVLLIVLAIGAVIGTITGMIIAYLKVPPFIATLGTMLVSRGLTAVIAEASRGMSSAVKYPATGWFQKVFTNLGGFPIGLVWVLVLTILCMVVMYKTKIGRYILAIGSNEEAARLSGIDTDKYKILAYIIGGFFASLAALFYVAANPSLNIASGNGMELDAIAGVYIGGTSTTGGSASIIGTILGSLILVIIRQGLNLAMSGGSAVSATNITYAVTGVIVVGAVLLDVLKKKNAAKVKIDTIDKAKAEKK